MKAFKLIPAVAFAAVMLASCNGNDPVTPRVLPYEFANKVVYMNEAGIANAFAEADYYEYTMVDGSDTVATYFFEDSVKRDNFISYMTSSTEITGAQFASLGSIFAYTKEDGASSVGYMRYFDKQSEAANYFSVVSLWAKEKIYDGKTWEGTLSTLNSDNLTFAEGKQVSDDVKSAATGDRKAFSTMFEANSANYKQAAEMGTVKGENDVYALRYFIQGDAYMITFMRTVK